MTDTFHVRPSVQQIANGRKLADLLFDVDVHKVLGKPLPTSHQFQQLIDEYRAGKIDGLTAIFMAMNEGTYEEKSHADNQ